jgi:hypothetical protein
MMHLLVALAIAAPWPACPPLEVPAQAVTVGLQTRGHTLAGTGIVQAEGERWSLTLLSPVGVQLFSISGPPRDVLTGLEAWRPWLARLPVQRDLALALGAASQRCRIAGGRLWIDADGVRRWRGRGGPARATVDGTRVTLSDTRRGYHLSLVTAP